MKLNILVLPGDGIGIEITREGVKVLKAVAAVFGHELNLSEGLIGGASLDATGEPDHRGHPPGRQRRRRGAHGRRGHPQVR